jgi:hypothetical protein
MLWLLRFHAKGSMSPTEFEALDQFIEATMLQAFTTVKGVRSARAFHSIHGQVVFLVDLEQTGSLDAVFESPEMGKACLGLSKWLVRANCADIMWEISERGTLRPGIVHAAMMTN